MSINEIIKFGAMKLKQNELEDAFNISRILLTDILKVSKEYLVIHSNDEISQINKEEFNEKIDKIANGYPLQYITHNQEFMKLNFFVNEDVLIPQPDTEILVEEVINICKNYKEKIVNILDLCTGSGAIAISIAKNVSNAKIAATDISIKALNVAKINAKNNNVKIDFVQSDLFKNIEDKFDIIVSNPPYIKEETIKSLPKDVQHEPEIALNGGLDGLDFYKRIAKEAFEFLNNNGYLVLEIGYDQKKDVIEILKEKNKYREIKCIKDYAGHDRVIIAKK